MCNGRDDKKWTSSDPKAACYKAISCSLGASFYPTARQEQPWLLVSLSSLANGEAQDSSLPSWSDCTLDLVSSLLPHQSSVRRLANIIFDRPNNESFWKCWCECCFTNFLPKSGMIMNFQPMHMSGSTGGDDPSWKTVLENIKFRFSQKTEGWIIYLLMIDQKCYVVELDIFVS